MASLTEKQIGPGPVPVWDIQTASAGQIDACCGLGKGINLLDNWYFGRGVINQRGVNTLATVSGVATYFHDRWYVYRGGCSLTGSWLKVDSLDSFGFYLYQAIDDAYRNFVSNDTNVPLVVSLLYKLSADGATKLLASAPSAQSITTSADGIRIQLSRLASNNNGKRHFHIRVMETDNRPLLIAAKLEIGSEQTLATKDGNGDWVLADPIPHPTLELLKCQRYFQTFATQSLRPVEAEDFRPVMRAKPTLGTITVGGKTLYTASADL